MAPDNVVRQDEPIPVEKPVCPHCGGDLDENAECVAKCQEPTTQTVILE